MTKSALLTCSFLLVLLIAAPTAEARGPGGILCAGCPEDPGLSAPFPKTCPDDCPKKKKRSSGEDAAAPSLIYLAGAGIETIEYIWGETLTGAEFASNSPLEEKIPVDIVAIKRVLMIDGGVIDGDELREWAASSPCRQKIFTKAGQADGPIVPTTKPWSR